MHKKPYGIIIFLGLIGLGIAIIYGSVRPVSPDFSVFAAGAERKNAFFNYFLPIIEQRNQQILETRQQISEWNQDRDSIGWWDEWQIQNLAEHYRMKVFDIDSDADWSTLLRRVDAVPPSLALAQAANESAWGTSRFARQGNNYFGQWCFRQGCGIVPARRDAKKVHEVAIFDSPQASVEGYIHNLNTHDAYRQLRQTRAKLKATQNPVTGIALTDGLARYSEKGTSYVEELRSMIRYNDLTSFDTP